MKKTLLLILSLAAISVFLLNSCRQKTIRTENKTYSNTVYLSNDTAGDRFTISIDVELPVAFHNRAVFDSILTCLNSNIFGEEFAALSADSVVNVFAEAMISDYRRTNELVLPDPDFDTIADLTGDILSSSFDIEGFSLLSNEKVYCYGINRDIYMGGAHGMYSTYYCNFNLETGDKIQESDLFSENYAIRLTALIQQKVLEQIQANLPSTKSLEESDFYEENIKPNGNFYITDESINYMFNPYEIAPYSYGQTEISISFAELGDLLKNNSILKK